MSQLALPLAPRLPAASLGLRLARSLRHARRAHRDPPRVIVIDASGRAHAGTPSAGWSVPTAVDAADVVRSYVRLADRGRTQATGFGVWPHYSRQTDGDIVRVDLAGARVVPLALPAIACAVAT